MAIKIASLQRSCQKTRTAELESQAKESQKRWVDGAFKAAFHGRKPNQPDSQKTLELMGLDTSLRNSVLF